MLKKGFILFFVLILVCPIILSSDLLVSDYMIQPKEINLKYFLNGEENEINFIVYESAKNYFFSIPRDMNSNGETISKSDFKISVIDEPLQKELLNPLVNEIRNLGATEEDDFRIAVSLVQSIPYGYSGEIISFFGIKLNYSRYPYEVVYDSSGICGEKTQLLSFLLKELGYDVSLFYYPEENHEALGVKCPLKESINSSGYCFIETTGRSIINDDSLIYSEGITLGSSPQIFHLFEGKSLPEKMSEYKDAKKMKKLRTGKFVLFRKWRIEQLNKKYNSFNGYYLD